MSRFEQSGALANHFVSRVARKLLECLIDPNNCAVSSTDDDGVVGGLEGSRLQLEEVF